MPSVRTTRGIYTRTRECRARTEAPLRTVLASDLTYRAPASGVPLRRPVTARRATVIFLALAAG